ncbi:MAG: hypothetical protein HKN47_20080 [Pirellulaceae bacterium]|nr:hypothetical protein [Pirellulaceae bacterium]
MFQQELNDRQLRYFGASLAALLWVFAAVAYWKWNSANIATALTVSGLLLIGVYYLIPNTQRGIYNAFRKITHPIQVVMTIIILGIVYYLVLTPIGLLLRLGGYGLKRQNDGQTSHWSKRDRPNQASRYFDTY